MGECRGRIYFILDGCMDVKSWLFVGICGVSLLGLSGCEVSSPANDPSPQSQQESARPVPFVSRVISENGYPVGIQVSAETLLRFSPPGAKLYTDSLAFQMAVQEGLNGVLISLSSPSWLSLCQSRSDAFLECVLEERTVYVQKEIEPQGEVWMAVPADHLNASDELNTLGESLRFESVE